MLISLRSLDGRRFMIECEPRDTFQDLKERIHRQEGIPIEEQVIIVAGQVPPNDDALEAYHLETLNCLHLVTRTATAFNFETHNLYVAVQNLYEESADPGRLGLISLDRVLAITGQESPDQLHDIFDTIFQIREERTSENVEKRGESHLASSAPRPILALVAVKRSDAIKMTPNHSIPNVGGATAKSFSLINNEIEALECQFSSYMLSNGTLISTPRNINAQMHAINQAFRLFCALKKAENPIYKRQTEDLAAQKFGEVKAYLEMTAEALFSDPTITSVEFEFRRRLLEGIRELGQGRQPSSELQRDNRQLYDEIMQFDIVSLAERFRTIRDMVQDSTQKDNCDAALRLLLNNAVDEIQAKYFSASAPTNGAPIIHRSSHLPTSSQKINDYDTALKTLEELLVSNYSDIKFNELNTKVRLLIQQVNDTKKPINELTEILVSTSNLLQNGNVDEYRNAADKMRGKPSLKLQILGGLMAVIGAIVAVCGIVAAVATPASIVGATVAIGGGGLVGVGLGIFAKGSKRDGFSQQAVDIVNEYTNTSPKNG